LRILHIVHQYPPDHVGGTELYTQTLALHQAKSGHEVLVFTPAHGSAGWPGPARDGGVSIYRVPTKARSATGEFLNTFGRKSVVQALAEVLERERPDLVHIQHLKGLPANLVDRLSDRAIPIIITLHDYWFRCANAQLITNYDQTICSGPNRWFTNCGRCAIVRAGLPDIRLLAATVAPLLAARGWALKKILSGARRLIAPTEFVRGLFVKLGVDADQIQVIPHGIIPPETIPARVDSPSGQLRIGYVGGISWQKGLHVLIQAVNRLPEDDLRLTIYGNTGAFPTYVARLEEMIRHPGISIAGPLGRDVFWETISDLDLIVVPALWYETASLIVQEAFAAGVPVIASNIGALGERVRNSIDGLHVPLGDVEALRGALSRFLQSPSLQRKLRAGIRPVYTIDQHMQEVDEVYSIVLNQGPKTLH